MVNKQSHVVNNVVSCLGTRKEDFESYPGFTDSIERIHPKSMSEKCQLQSLGITLRSIKVEYF